MWFLIYFLIDDISVEVIFYVLFDFVWVVIYVELVDLGCVQICLIFFMIKDWDILKLILLQYFCVLCEVGLIYSEWQGVEMCNILCCVEIEQCFFGLIGVIMEVYCVQLVECVCVVRCCVKGS